VILLLVTIGLSYTGYLLRGISWRTGPLRLAHRWPDAAPPPEVGKAVALLLKAGRTSARPVYCASICCTSLRFRCGDSVIFVHYYKVVRARPLAASGGGADRRRYGAQGLAGQARALPADVFTNELVWFGILMVALVVPIVLNIYNAPLEHAANPSNTPLHTVAPWYFLFIQGWLKLGDKTFWGVIFPTILIGLLLLWPYIDYNPSRRYGDRRIALAAMFIIIGVLVVSSYMGTPGFAVTTAPQIEIGYEYMRLRRSVPFAPSRSTR